MGKVLGIGLLALAQLVDPRRGRARPVQILGRLVLPTTTVGAVVQLLTWFILGFALYSTTHGLPRRARVPAGGGLGRLDARHADGDDRVPPSIVVVTGDPNGILAHVMTFIPPAAPMVVPLRDGARRHRAVGDRARIVLMVASIWFLFVVGARIYSGAVLQTGGRMKLRDAWRASPLTGGSARGLTSPSRKHETRWSLTSPADCISA